MTVDKKKQIYLGEEVLEEQTLDIFSRLGLDVCSSNESDESASDFDWQINTSENETHAITFKKQIDLISFLKNNGRAIICPSITDNKLSEVLLGRFFNGVSSLDPSAEIAPLIDENFNLKITDPLTIGYYIDLLTEQAIVSDFNFVAIRNYINSLLTFFSYLKKAELAEIPFDIDYGVSDETYYLQVSIKTKNFFVDNLVDALNGNDYANPFRNSLLGAYNNTNVLEIFSLEKGAKLCFCSSWVKADKLDEDFFPSLLVHHLFSLDELRDTPSLKSMINLETRDINNDRVAYPGAGAQNYLLDNGKTKNKNIILIKEVIEYMEEKRALEGKDLFSFNREKYDDYLPGFPKQESIIRLTEEDILEVITCLNNDKKRENFFKTVKSYKNDLVDEDYFDKVVDQLENFEDDILTRILEKTDYGDESSELVNDESGNWQEENTLVKGTKEDLDESQRVSGTREESGENQLVKGELEGSDKVEVVSGQVEDIDDQQLITGDGGDLADSQRVKGIKESLGNDSQRVKGSSDNPDQGVYIIKSGSSAKDKKEAWKLKSSKITNNVKEKVKELRLSGVGTEAMGAEIKNLLKKELGENSPAVDLFFENITDRAADQVATDTEVEETSMFDNIDIDLDFELPDDDEDDIDPRKVEMLEGAISLRDKQLVKMKKLIDRMKYEVEKERNASQLVKEAQDKALEKIKNNKISEQISKLDVKEEDNTSEIELALRDYITKTTDLKRDLDKVNGELSSTQSALVLETKNKENLTLNLNRQIKALEDKISDYEFESGKNDSKLDISNLTHENESLQKQIENLKRKMSIMFENSRKSQEDSVSGAEYEKLKKEVADNSSKVAEAVREKREALEQNKTLSIKLKASEQRLKNLSTQTDKTQKQSKGSSAVAADSKVAHRVKHLEKTNERLQALNKKVSDELAEKKTELHKSKMEAKTLQAKVKDLERKAGKKAA